MLDKSAEFEASADDRGPKKMTLLRRYDIPVEHLDFSYVENCTEVKEIEKILKVLRSGEEGMYFELTTFVEKRLQELDPTSRVLRVEIPVLQSSSEPKLRDEISNDISEWLETLDVDEKVHTKIFDAEDIKQRSGMKESPAELPIRGQGLESSIHFNKDDFVKASNPDRIKSWEYEKWDKFDVDKELIKFDITDAQINEWEKNEKKPLEEATKKETEALMRNLKVDNKNVKQQEKVHQQNVTTPQVKKQQVQKTSEIGSSLGSKEKCQIGVDKASFIEEMPMTSGNVINPPEKKPQRRIKIQIEDVNVRF